MLPRNSGSILVKFLIIIPSCQLHLICEHRGREGWAPKSIVSMVIHHNTLLGLTCEVRGGTLIVGVLGAHAPMTGFQKGAEVFRVIRTQFVALKTVWKDGFLRMMTESLPEDGARVGIFVIGWTLTCEDARDV